MLAEVHLAANFCLPERNVCELRNQYKCDIANNCSKESKNHPEMWQEATVELTNIGLS